LNIDSKFKPCGGFTIGGRQLYLDRGFHLIYETVDESKPAGAASAKAEAPKPHVKQVERTVLDFAPPTDADQSEPADQGPTIPSGVRLDLSLETPITSATSAVGDAITAKLIHAVPVTGMTIPEGTIVNGRIGWLEHHGGAKKYFNVSLEFSTLRFGERNIAIHARLVAARIDASAATNLTIDDSLPPAGGFLVPGDELRLGHELRVTLETGAAPI
jgi:hypothetical protein